jgi:drug/metabolite transporter (DMT)-like permease
MTTQFRGILALLVVTLVWGSTFPAMKGMTDYFSPAWIITIRFVIASVLLSPFLWKARRRDLTSGALLGVVLFASFMFQVQGLSLTSSNRNAFVTGLNVLIVPLLGVFAGRMPERRIFAALVLAIAGLVALCWDSGTWGKGDSLALAGAFCFAFYITMMEKRTQKATRLMTLTAAQIVTVTVCAAVWLLAREVPRSTIDATQDFRNYWQYIGHGLVQYAWNFAYLGIVATAAIISLQSWGQARTTANEAAVMYAFEPAAAALFGFFWLGEALTGRGWIGAALLISGMIISQWNSARPPGALAPE